MQSRTQIAICFSGLGVNVRSLETVETRAKDWQRLKSVLKRRLTEVKIQER